MAEKNYKAENLVLGAMLLAGAYWYFTSGTDAVESPKANAVTSQETGVIVEKVRVCTDPDIQGASFRALSAGDAVESERLMDPSRCNWLAPGTKVRLTGRKQRVQLSESPADAVEYLEFEAQGGGFYWTSEFSVQ
ncbi:hypothetical protein [Sinorhizobium meliloti]|uniref:hypothetical protein n=1 Tax=Rhizobium meliloti TaxID=382 RepID=UPI0011C3BA5C|nr:hypothetical protein [Sinorhizobium meliloti]